ncbi:DUF2541 family protein [Parvicella tangerina]|uniref:DUF2541 family protein n=1 Tax=Parvicella tangerina TaxID=2829795 RepID=A0A916JRC8_9FLAO|nr:DUF2541 family protein [Parvicella tangerina]CAG5087173.1 hypothetical protein CRYO30217_03406 [Parvicella tangerina]
MNTLQKTLSTIIILLLFVPAFAQHPPKHPKHVNAPAVVKHKWEKLGSKTVNMKADTDHLLVTAYEGAFTKVKFHVAKAPIHVKSITIIFANGETKHIAINKDFPKGTNSKVFDLPGNKRVIQKIRFEYQTIDNGNGKAIVTAFGKH